MLNKIKLFIDINTNKVVIGLLEKRKKILYDIIKAQKSIIKTLGSRIKANKEIIDIQKSMIKTNEEIIEIQKGEM